MSNCEVIPHLTIAAARLRETIDANRLSALSDADLQVLFAAVVRAYAAKRDAGNMLAAFGSNASVTATDVAVAASAMMEAVNMAAFELGMWQTLKGQKI